jgi:hypothetical protein
MSPCKPQKKGEMENRAQSNEPRGLPTRRGPGKKNPGKETGEECPVTGEKSQMM